MATTQTKKPAPVFSVPVSGVGKDQGQRLRVPQHFRYDNTLATISNQYPDGVAVIDLPVGQYTYRQISLSVSNTITIATKTFAHGLRHFVDTVSLSTYVSRVQLEIDGKIEQDYFIDELVDFNKLMNWDARNGILTLAFGSPGMFNDEIAEDAYLLGTSDLRSLRVLVTLKTAWLATMKLNVGCEYARVSRPIGYLVTMRRTRYAAAASGPITIADLPHGIDLAAIWIRSISGNFAGDVDLEVDTETVFQGTALEMQSLNQIWGKDNMALPNADIFLDFWRERDAGKGLASLNLIQQIRRNATIRLTLTFDTANATFYALTFHCGPYQAQR